MHESVRSWAAQVLDPAWVTGKRVLEVGAYDVNGSLGPMVRSFTPQEYVGVDLRAGPGVDVVVAAEDMNFRSRYDLIVCTEMLEHAFKWRDAVIAMKRALVVGGVILLTTRGPGAGRHAYPDDYWRFTTSDLAAAFADFDVIDLREDPASPGAFICARRVSRTVFWPHFVPMQAPA